LQRPLRRPVISLSHGSSVRRLQKAGIEASVIDEPDDRLAVRALAKSWPTSN